MEEKSRQVNRCLREPILLYESTSQDLPAHLKRMLVALNDIELTQSDRLVILAYILMVEAGFLPVHAANHFDSVNKCSTFNITHLQSAEMMPNGWKKSEGVYSMNFVLPVLPDHALSLIAQTAGNIVVFSEGSREC
ncbi:uncharacterized protein LOC124167819 isoform X2 [Ischnura elegans]|uniref:uncharacterized protein LOC124167819 isoform X2 n=1 Tax=Ischnura elegans TaxID=197161 RepID=UPI001ED8A3F4|nr:uncharacterized protein LOC124167819 isoform X2 [Ischnura elegans]